MPERYDLEEDVPFGLAGADFPVTFYDRPELMFGNLLRGDIDGMTRSMLAPDTLSPSQMKDVKDILLRGKKPSPVMKTILEISTNPLVIIGLVAALRYPMGSTKVLLDLRRGLLPKAAAMGKMTSGLHGALMSLRTIPWAFESLLGIVQGAENFASRYGSKANTIFVEANTVGKVLSKNDGAMIAARLDGLHSPKHYVVKLFQNESEFQAFFGGKDVPIMANLQTKMGPKLNSVADKLRGVYKGIWDELFADPATKASRMRSAALKGLQLGEGEIEFYLPHQGQFNKYHAAQIRGMTGVEYRKYASAEYARRLGREEIQRLGGMLPERQFFLDMETAGAAPKGFVAQVMDPILRRWSDDAAKVAGDIWNGVKAIPDAAEQRIEFAKRMTEYYTKGPGKSTNFIGRLGSRRTARDTLDAMAGALQDAAGRPEAITKELQDIGRVLAEPPTYSMDVWKTTQRYINSTASDYGYHATGMGEKITKIIRTPGIFKDAPHLESYLVEGLMPHIMGYNTYGQMQRVALDATRKTKMLGWIKNHPMVEQTLGANHTKALTDWLSKPSSLSSDTLGGQAANWFHLSTLGLNLAATSANSMQTFITTILNVGPQGIYRGLMGYAGEEGLISRAGRYMSMRAGGVASNEAWRKAFPEFIEEMGEWSKTTERLLSGDVASAGFPTLFKAKGIWDKVKGAMMLPFSGTEAGNQLLAFYSGRHAHLFQNATKMGTAALSAEANKVGGSLALLTQFSGGPLGIPRAIMNMNPLWRQYMHFPMRYLAYLHGSLRMGVDPNKLDWGTIGRGLALSTGLMIAGRNLAGIDLSRGLMVGALPLPGYEKAPFYPFPFVPPVAGVAGELGRALLTGEPKQLGATASMLVPGGIALRRAYMSLSPRFADYENPTQDGRVPLYNKDGALIGAMSPMELTLRSIGLKPSSISAEAGAAKWLLSQRDRIRQYRRDYTQAIFENDTQQAERINKDFQKVYPELGPIQIKKTDIRALENRREISRLHRISAGISKSYRPLFEQAIGEASLGRLTEDIQVGGMEALQNYIPNQ